MEAKDERNQLSSVEEIEINIIDNDDKNHSPQFLKPEYNAMASEDQPIGSPIITIEATDIDNDLISYSLQGDNCEELSIDKGVVSYQVAPNDRSKGSLVCVVVASDGKNSADTTLLLRIEKSDKEIRWVIKKFGFKNMKKKCSRITEKIKILEVFVVRPNFLKKNFTDKKYFLKEPKQF